MQADKAHIGGRVEALEEQWEDVSPTLQAITERCKMQDQRLNVLLEQMDDFKNRSRRVNIHIRGLPEATGPQDIVPTLQGIFKQILGCEALITLKSTGLIEYFGRHPTLMELNYLSFQIYPGKP